MLHFLVRLVGLATVVLGLQMAGKGRLSVYRLQSREALQRRSLVPDVHRCRSDPQPTEISAVERRIADVADEIAEVAKTIKAVAVQIEKVGAMIEATEITLEQDDPPSSPRQSDNFERKLTRLTEEKAMLMEKKAKLMDKEAKLMDKEAKEEGLKIAMKVVPEFMQVHDAWSSKGKLRLGTLFTRATRNFDIVQDFQELRTSCYTVDKSHFIHLVQKSKCVVFRRPRRHGKSLFLSMLKYYFYGAVKLFEGLAVYNETHERFDSMWCPSDPSKHNFAPFPVVHLDFSVLRQHKSADAFSDALAAQIIGEARKNGLDIDSPSEKRPSEALHMVLQRLSECPSNKYKKTVLLIDEYDAPLNERPDSSVFDEILEVYCAFFTTVNSLDKIIQFVYVTGITSYGMSGIYSGANNFVDLTSDVRFESMCAFTENEFRRAIEETRPSVPPISDQAMAEMKEQYNGYSWNLELPRSERETLFNPYFVARFCSSGKIEDFWAQTSSGSLLSKFPALATLNLNEPVSVKREVLTTPWYRTSDTKNTCVKTLFEAGYFTVIDAEPIGAPGTLLLGLPNEQTRKLFKSDYLANIFGVVDDNPGEFAATKKALLNGDLIVFFKYLDKLRAAIPFQHAAHFKKESSFLIQTFQLLWIMDIDFVCEEPSAKGRSDILFFIPSPHGGGSGSGTVYALELKALTCAEGDSDKLQIAAINALNQIKTGGHLDGLFVNKHKNANIICGAVIAADVDERTRRFAMLALSRPGAETDPEFITVDREGGSDSLPT